LGILAIVITTTIAMFAERSRRLRQAHEVTLAFQALANEAELWRRVDFKDIDAQPLAFRSDLTIINPMAPYSASVKIDTPRSDVRNITLTIRSEEHTSELQSRFDLVCRLLLEKKKKKK